jgi:methylthioribose-1-phosphate isomerase
MSIDHLEDFFLMHNTQHGLQQLNQCRQTAQQLIQQTQQSSNQYRQMLHQEQQNIQMLQQILTHEQQAAHTIQQALQGHDLAIQKCQQIVNMCNQMQQELNGQTSVMHTNVSSLPFGQNTPFQQQSFQQ